MTQDRGWRLNTYQAFLKEKQHQYDNLTIQTNTIVDKLLFSDGSDSTNCTGVRCKVGNEHLDFTAKKEVVLSAGSIGES